MKEIQKIHNLVWNLLLIIMILLVSCSVSRTTKQPVFENIISNKDGKGELLEIVFTSGKAHNHPSMAIWVEDTSGNYLQTLYVTKAATTGIFEHGDASSGTWKPGYIERPAALPYWYHRRPLSLHAQPKLQDTTINIPDAYTGPTPLNDFDLTTKLNTLVSYPFMVYMEINQTWDWNEYWTNNKYPDDEDYKTSCQPALVYKATVSPNQKGIPVQLQLVGHSHYSGKDGNLYTDLSTITTAKQIASNITVTLK